MCFIIYSNYCIYIGGTVLSRRLGMSENSTPLGLQPSTSLSIKDVSYHIYCDYRI